jgi:peptide chain release factor 2
MWSRPRATFPPVEDPFPLLPGQPGKLQLRICALRSARRRTGSWTQNASTPWNTRWTTWISAPPNCGGIFDYPAKRSRLDEVVRLTEDPALWSDAKRAQDIGKERKALEAIVGTLDRVAQELQDNRELIAMARAEDDLATLEAVAQDVGKIETAVAELEFRRMFSNPLDPRNCFLDIQSGAGGTEAQDWASLLERMYLRFCERRGFTVEVLEESSGEVAGISSASLKVSGDYAYGTLRTETGVHRLVRKSPFDSNARRHTSFASVFVYPEVDDSIQIDINPADLRIDTFRASGAGGQHVNRTDSAVRITHLPTNIVVQCQSDRSQHRNRAEAMAMLKSRMYEHELRKREAEKQKVEDSKTDIAWGHQIRNYILDQSIVKDLRTNVETGNTRAVLDGDLDQFITASLKQGV